jgi:hypothetical protein
MTEPTKRPKRAIAIYLDANDWWIGYYRGETHHYVCLLPIVVMRWNRGKAKRIQRFCTLTPGCRLADGHNRGCDR